MPTNSVSPAVVEACDEAYRKTRWRWQYWKKHPGFVTADCGFRAAPCGDIWRKQDQIYPASNGWQRTPNGSYFRVEPSAQPTPPVLAPVPPVHWQRPLDQAQLSGGTYQ